MTSVPSTPLVRITEPVQIQNTAAPIMYIVQVSNIAVNQQQAEITEITLELLSATPTLQETLNKMMSRITQIENRRKLDPSSCHIVTKLNGGRDRQQKISELFDESLMSSSYQSKKRTTVEDNVSKDGNLQLHEEIIDTIIGERQSKQNSGPGIISKLAVGIKRFWTEDSKNNTLLRDAKTNWLSLKIVNT